jgi:hypothetical protein
VRTLVRLQQRKAECRHLLGTKAAREFRGMAWNQLLLVVVQVGSQQMSRIGRQRNTCLLAVLIAVFQTQIT